MPAEAEERVQGVGDEHGARKHQDRLDGHSGPEGRFTCGSPRGHMVPIGQSSAWLDLAG